MSDEKILKCECEKNHSHFEKRFHEVARITPEMLPFITIKSMFYLIKQQIDNEAGQIQKPDTLLDNLSSRQIAMNQDAKENLNDIKFEMREIENLYEELRQALQSAEAEIFIQEKLRG